MLPRTLASERAKSYIYILHSAKYKKTVHYKNHMTTKFRDT